MKIVDAVWEKRNLNTKTVEITLEEADGIEEIKKTLKEQDASYQVIRVPASRYDYNEIMTQFGFVFIETICSMKNDMKNLKLDMISERMKSQMVCEIMTSADIQVMYKDFENGIFTTDRIAVDPHFSVELANKRYIGWIGDALERGATALNIYYKNQPAGFVVYKADGDIADVLLGGMYSDFVTKGIGVAVYSKAYEYIKEQGIKKTFTAVSTNNNSSYRANMAIGYDVYKFDYIYIKHIES